MKRIVSLLLTLLLSAIIVLGMAAAVFAEATKPTEKNLFVSPSSAGVTENNLIKNPSFLEGDGKDGAFLSWSLNDYEGTQGKTPAAFSVDSGIFYVDKTAANPTTTGRSAVIESTTKNDARYQQKVPVEANSYYLISCMAKSENIGDAKGVNLSVLDITDTSNELSGTTDWTLLQMCGLTSPTQKDLTVTLGIGGYGSENTGKAWFDNVKVVKVASVPEGMVSVNFFNKTVDTGGSNTFLNILIVAVIALAIIIFLTVMFFRKDKRKVNAVEDFTEEEPDSTADADMKLNKSDSKSNLLQKGGKSSVKNVAISKKDRYEPRKIQKLRLNKIDFIFMAGIAIIAGILYLSNLGSFTAPQTFWQPDSEGESVTFNLGKEYTLDKIMIFGGVNERYPGDDGKYFVRFFSSEKNDFLTAIQPWDDKDKDKNKYRDKELVEYWKKNYVATETWNKVPVNCTTSKIKFVVESPKATLNEIAFYEKGSTTPIKGVTIDSSEGSPNDNGTVAKLIDEQNIIPERFTYMTGTYFDEIYHPRTAYEFIHRMSPYETTHPPLGKDIMTLGIDVFGMVPFGWRCMGALFGVLNILAIFLLAKKLFKKSFYAMAASIMLMFDFMNFTQSRIGLIDVYAVFFIMLMYFFMYDAFVNKSYDVGYKKSLIPLFLCGVMLGLGAASKWIGIYAAAGLAVLLFIAKFREYKEYKMFQKKRIKPYWYEEFMPKYMFGVLGMCAIFFIAIPIIIYILSYIPFIMCNGQSFDSIWQNQIGMLSYHQGVNATHPFMSHWYEWPFMIKPMFYYEGGSALAAAGDAAKIVAMGNPAVWWTGIVTFFMGIYLAVRRKDNYMAIVYIAICCQYFVWIFVSRTVFIYHFYSTVPFLILTTVYCIKCFVEMFDKRKRKIPIIVTLLFLLLVVALFIWFYPGISGVEVSKEWIASLKWMPAWPFNA